MLNSVLRLRKKQSFKNREKHFQIRNQSTAFEEKVEDKYSIKSLLNQKTPALLWREKTNLVLHQQ